MLKCIPTINISKYRATTRIPHHPRLVLKPTHGSGFPSCVHHSLQVPTAVAQGFPHGGLGKHSLTTGTAHVPLRSHRGHGQAHPKEGGNVQPHQHCVHPRVQPTEAHQRGEHERCHQAELKRVLQKQNKRSVTASCTQTWCSSRSWYQTAATTQLLGKLGAPLWQVRLSHLPRKVVVHSPLSEVPTSMEGGAEINQCF